MARLDGNPNDHPIPALHAILLEKFDPPGLHETNRILLRQRIQRPNESAVEFANALQEMATHCGWQGAVLNENLKTQLIIGLTAKEVKVRLIPPEVTFEDARQIAIQHEVLQNHLKLIMGQQQVNAVSSRAGHSSTPPSRGRGRGAGARGRGRGAANNNPPASSSNSSRGRQPTASTAPRGRGRGGTGGRGGHPSRGTNGNECYRCGRDHDPTTCPAREWTCYKCNKKGHIAPKCRTIINQVEETEDINSIDLEFNDMVAQSSPFLTCGEVGI